MVNYAAVKTATTTTKLGGIVQLASQIAGAAFLPLARSAAQKLPRRACSSVYRARCIAPRKIMHLATPASKRARSEVPPSTAGATNALQLLRQREEELEQVRREAEEARLKHHREAGEERQHTLREKHLAEEAVLQRDFKAKEAARLRELLDEQRAFTEQEQQEREREAREARERLEELRERLGEEARLEREAAAKRLEEARAEAERERARAVDLEATLERTKATLVAERDALAKRLGDAERARAAMQVAVNDGKERLKQAQLTSTGAVQLLRASTAEAERKVAVAGGALAERTAELDAAKLQLAQLHAAAMTGGGGGGRSPGLTTPAMAPRPYSATPALMTAPPALVAPPTRGLKAQRASLLDTLREERVKLDRERALIRSGGGLYGAPRGS